MGVHLNTPLEKLDLSGNVVLVVNDTLSPSLSNALTKSIFSIQNVTLKTESTVIFGEEFAIIVCHILLSIVFNYILFKIINNINIIYIYMYI